MKFIILALAVLVCGASAFPRSEDGPQCQAPNGGGLIPVIREFIAMVPKDKILDIYMNAVSNDAEVQEALEYLSSEEFGKVVVAVRTRPEFNLINDFLCTKLFVDAIYYQNKLGEVIGLPPIPRPMSLEPRTRQGFHGMILDMIEVLPVEKLRELFREKAKTDEYVKLALELAKSPELHSLVETLHATPEYNKMLNELRQKGVKVDEIIAFVKKYLGLN